MELRNFRVADTFGIEAPKGKTVRGLKDRHPLVPDVDPYYVFAKQSLLQVLGWWETRPYKPPLYLTGPSEATYSVEVAPSADGELRASLKVENEQNTGNWRLEVEPNGPDFSWTSWKISLKAAEPAAEESEVVCDEIFPFLCSTGSTENPFLPFL